MKIAVIGPGSMGLLYGAKLSKCADLATHERESRVLFMRII
jgi:ketopantoate reductase